MGCFLTGGPAHDLVGADQLPPSMLADMLIADKAFGVDKRVIGDCRKFRVWGRTMLLKEASYATPQTTYDPG